jgi:hypothetical protein
MSVVHIFRIPQVVELTTGTGASLMNYPVNRTDFHLARFVDNEVEFWIKNIDRKAVPLTGAVLTMHISDPKSRKVILTRDLSVLDAAKGLVRLFVSGEEAASMPKGHVRYSITLLRPDGVQVMLYTDRDRKGSGNIEIVDGPMPEPIEATRLSLADFLDRSGKLYSTAVPGAAYHHNLSGQHSLVLDFNDFVGRFTVQGTLSPSPGVADGQWFNVKVLDYVEPTAARLHIPFEGNLMHVRFVVELVSGNIDGITYRT